MKKTMQMSEAVTRWFDKIQNKSTKYTVECHNKRQNVFACAHCARCKGGKQRIKTVKQQQRALLMIFPRPPLFP